MTSVLAVEADMLFTPFGVPFDTAVIAGVVLTGMAVLLAGRDGRATGAVAPRAGGEPARRGGAQPAEDGEEDPS